MAIAETSHDVAVTHPFLDTLSRIESMSARIMPR
jgi:hypothetical protein